MTRHEGAAATTGQTTPAAAVTYEIRVAAHLDDHWAVTLGDLDLIRHDDGTTSLTGPVLDQAQLHGLLARVRDLGVPLLTLRAATDRPVAAPAAAAPPDEQVEKVWGGAVRLGAGRVLRSGRWRRLRATAWLLLLVLVTALAFGLPLQWTADRLPDDPGWQLVGTLVACVSALVVYGAAVRVGEGRGVCELALRPAARELAAGALLGLALMAVLMGTLAATGLYDISSSGAPSPATGLRLALQAAVTEELWMRALLFRLLWRAFGALPAFVVSALAFAALHLANPGVTLLSTATVATAGVMFCALYALTGRLWAPLGLHVAWNLAQGHLFGASVSGGDLGGSVLRSTPRPGAATWLTGGAFGPEASVLALVLLALVTVVTIRAASRRSGCAVADRRGEVGGGGGADRGHSGTG